MPDLTQTEFVTAVVGPGTGFGAATLIKRDGRLTSLSGEAGHVGFAPENPLQVELLAGLANEFGRVSDERLVSGSGLVNIYQFLAARSQTASERFEAATIFSRLKRTKLPSSRSHCFLSCWGRCG